MGVQNIRLATVRTFGGLGDLNFFALLRILEFSVERQQSPCFRPARCLQYSCTCLLPQTLDDQPKESQPNGNTKS